jgi:glycosyltransferase involved in cell wall biosynthesis
MNILFVHNYYQQLGGEDISFEVDSSLLEAHGHRVIRYTLHNDRIRKMRPFALALSAYWNNATYRDLLGILRRERISAVIIKNFFPLVSPSAFFAANARKIPVLQYLSNFRLLCPNAFLFRDGHVCEDCLGKSLAWPGILHACYRNDHAASATVASMVLFHRLLRTWQTRVSAYIAMTEFSRSKFIQGGLPPEKIVIKPNCVEKGAPSTGRQDGHALFIGRLSAEKGISTLLAAWGRLSPQRELQIVGQGPLAGEVERASKQHTNIKWLGIQSREQIRALMQRSRLLVVPSLWYEICPRVIVEAFAAGLPVIGSNLGSIASIVHDRRTGLLFEAGNPEDLSEKVAFLMENRHEQARIRKNIREEYLSQYSPEINYRIFIRLLEKVCG